MEIRTFRVERFRSISTAALDLRDFTVLVGPNNEGKSNIMRAMVLGMDALAGFARTETGPRYRLRTGLSGPVDFDWDRDFPLKRRSTLEQTTALEFEFELSPAEIVEFDAIVGSKINGNLRVRLTFDSDGYVQFKAVKQRSGGAWTKRAGQIANFVGRRVGVEYVPSVRTAAEASAVVARLVAAELRGLEDDADYVAALKTIRDLQQPKLDEIAESVRETLAHFLPEVKSVSIALPESRRQFAVSRAIEITVDDGHATSLGSKGDGVQSLAAVALLRKSAMDRGRARTFVLAVEEPEAHLHPLAVRELRKVLTEISDDQQVVVTTHSPLLADPLRVERNVIVENNRARAAKEISQVRDCLGVRLEDNLQSAQLALIVEGESDVRILRALLSDLDDRLEEDLANGRLVIEGLGGGGKLHYRLSQYASGVCGAMVFFDGDSAGQNAVSSAISDGLLREADYMLAVASGKKEAEVEDLLDPTVYLDAVNTQLGLRLKASEIRKGTAKWSSRMKSLAEKRGKLWTKATETRMKIAVADAVSANPGISLLQGVELIDDLVVELTGRLHP